MSTIMADHQMDCNIMDDFYFSFTIWETYLYQVFSFLNFRIRRQ